MCVCHFSDPEKNACQHQLWVSYVQQPLCHFSDPGNHATHHWKKKHLRWHMVLSSSMCQISRCNFQFSMCKVETFHEFSWPWLYMKTTANPWLPCWTVICHFARYFLSSPRASKLCKLDHWLYKCLVGRHVFSSILLELLSWWVQLSQRPRCYRAWYPLSRGPKIQLMYILGCSPSQ